MNITLVCMPNNYRTTPSLGLAYLNSALKKKHNVDKFEFHLSVRRKDWIDYIEDFNKDTEIKKKIINDDLNLKNRPLLIYLNYCYKKVINSHPQIVGFSVSYKNENISLLLAKKLKAQGIKIILGGPETFCDDKETISKYSTYIDYGFADFVVFGEAESVFPALMDKIDSKEIIDIPNILLPSTEGAKYTGKGPLQDINSIDYPAFDDEDIKKSLCPWFLPILGSRGCTNNCDFCIEKVYWGKYRARKPQDIVEEIKYHIQRHNITAFRFNDLLLNSDTNNLRDFCRMLIDKGLNVTWGGNIRVSSELDKDTINLMAKAGCRFVHIGVESGSNHVLDNMNKGIKVEQTEALIQKIHDNLIWTNLEIIVGHHSERYEDFLKTLKFLNKNKDSIDSFFVRSFNLLGWSDAYNKKGIRYIDKNIGEERRILVEKIFKHQLCFPRQILKMKEPIDYKNSSNPKINSSITVNQELLDFHLLEKWKLFTKS